MASIIFGNGKIEPDETNEYSWIPDESKSKFVRAGFGAATKLGFYPAAKIFTGLGLDLGLQLLHIPTWIYEYVYTDYTFRGLEIVPKLVFDFLVTDREDFKMAIAVTLGVVIAPNLSLELTTFGGGFHAVLLFESEDGSIEHYEVKKLRFDMWQILPVISFGVNLGG